MISRTTALQSLLALGLSFVLGVVSSTTAVGSFKRPSFVQGRQNNALFGLVGGARRHRSSVVRPIIYSILHDIPRGGSSVATESDEDEDEEDDDEDTEADDEKPSKNDITSMEPIKVKVKTNLNNKLVDCTTVELDTVRTRNVEAIKKSLSRMLPGKPPMDMIRLLQHGQILSDELLVDELMEEEEDDEDDEDTNDDDDERKPTLTLTLDMVPPMDPRAGDSLMDEHLPESSTADLLEAYTLNEAAIWWSSQQLMEERIKEEATDEDDEDVEEDDGIIPAAYSYAPKPPLISFQLRQYATALKSRLEETSFTEKASALLEDPIPPALAEAEEAKQPQIRGDRVRPAKDGGGGSAPVMGLKQTVQYHLNIDWGNTIKNFCLFLFFGFFGGRTVTSRALLMLGAPMCFIAQARPVRVLTREILYLLLKNPPSIILSLLPAPQQAMLALSDEDAMRMIYGDDAPQTSAAAMGEEMGDEDDETDVDADESEEEEEDGSEEEEESSDEEEESGEEEEEEDSDADLFDYYEVTSPWTEKEKQQQKQQK